MTSLTSAQVWSASLADPKFASEMPEGSPTRVIIQPFIEAAPTALAEFLDRPLTLKVFIDAKVAFLRYCLDNGFAEKMSDAVGFGGELVESALEAVIEMLAEVFKNVPAFLDERGITEEQVLLSPEVGLNDENKALYKSGTLTVADVLRTQPAVILKNSD